MLAAVDSPSIHVISLTDLLSLATMLECLLSEDGMPDNVLALGRVSPLEGSTT
jgi:hypothetical protein